MAHQARSARGRRVALGLVVIAGLAATLFGGARSLVRTALFPAPTDPTVPRLEGARLLAHATSDGATVRALVVAPNAGARTIVHLHGNGETIGDNVDLAAHLVRHGFGVALVEYRGYGVSRDEPSPDENGLYADAEGALELLRADGISAERLVVWGTSIGSGVAAEMARRGRCASLVLVTPYTSIPAVVERMVPFLPVHRLVSDRFDTSSKAAEITVPTLIVHGTDDEIIPFDMGRALASQIRDARLVTVPGGRHNDLFARDGARLMNEIVRHARGEPPARR